MVSAQSTPFTRTTLQTAPLESAGKLPATKSKYANNCRLQGVTQALQLQTFEDTYVGHVNDSDDEGFMEFKLSVYHQFDFFEAIMNRLRRNKLDEAKHYLNLNFAFTGRFAQYIATRTSSPVVGKRFNPYIFLGYDFKNHPYNQLRLGYGHESNGQSVVDPITYNALVSSLVPSKQGPDVHRQALDNISRGWDYLSLSYTAHTQNNKWSYELALRRYLRWGFLQGDKEEYLSWENQWYGEQLERNDVSGLAAAIEYDPDLRILGRDWLRLSRLKLLGITGNNFNSIGRRGGGKAMLVVSFYDIPLTISYASGYDGDIAQYGKVNHSWGLGVTLNSFKQPMAPIALTGGGLN